MLAMTAALHEGLETVIVTVKLLVSLMSHNWFLGFCVLFFPLLPPQLSHCADLGAQMGLSDVEQRKGAEEGAGEKDGKATPTSSGQENHWGGSATCEGLVHGEFPRTPQEELQGSQPFLGTKMLQPLLSSQPPLDSLQQFLASLEVGSPEVHPDSNVFTKKRSKLSVQISLVAHCCQRLFLF